VCAILNVREREREEKEEEQERETMANTLLSEYCESIQRECNACNEKVQMWKKEGCNMNKVERFHTTKSIPQGEKERSKDTLYKPFTLSLALTRSPHQEKNSTYIHAYTHTSFHTKWQ